MIFIFDYSRIEIMIADEIRGTLVILSFYRALIRDSNIPLQKRAMQFEVKVLDTPDLKITRLV